MLGGLATRSAQHRDILCRLAAQGLEAIAGGALSSDVNKQVADRYSCLLPVEEKGG